MEAIIIFLVIIGIIGIVVYKSNQSTKKKQAEEKGAIEYKIGMVKEYFERVNQDKKIPIITSHLLLKDNEVAYLNDDVRLFETRKVTISNRGGGAMRIAKGIYIGGTSGASRGYDELREIDQGKLVLTNKRLIFDGDQNTRDIKLEKLVSISQYIDGIEIAIEGKNKSQIYIGMFNPILWKTLIYFVRQIPASGEIPTANIEIQ